MDPAFYLPLSVTKGALNEPHKARIVALNMHWRCRYGTVGAAEARTRHPVSVPDDGYQPAGSARRHWLWREPDKMWQVAVTTILGSVVYGTVFFAMSHEPVAAVLSAAALAVIFGGRSALRLRRRQAR